eukprot:15436199-Alexandrium_andersonii.AAC.1
MIGPPTLVATRHTPVPRKWPTCSPSWLKHSSSRVGGCSFAAPEALAVGRAGAGCRSSHSPVCESAGVVQVLGAAEGPLELPGPPRAQA